MWQEILSHIQVTIEVLYHTNNYLNDYNERLNN